MKKLILTILTTLTILGVNAQGNNLQFNRALFETIFSSIPDNLSPNYTILNSFTVPTGKVWKITDVNSSNRTSTNTEGGFISEFLISKNAQNEFIRIKKNVDKTQEIIWLPEGSYDISLSGLNGTSSIQYNIIVSGIEFNIVP